MNNLLLLMDATFEFPSNICANRAGIFPGDVSSLFRRVISGLTAERSPGYFDVFFEIIKDPA